MSDETALEKQAQSFLSTIRIYDTGEISTKVQAILALRAFGFENTEIANLLGYKDGSGIRHILKRHDPAKDMEKADAMRRLVLTSMAEMVAFRSLLKIAGSEDYDTLGAEAHMKIACMAAKFSKDLSAPARIKASVREKELLAELMDREEKTIEGEVE